MTPQPNPAHPLPAELLEQEQRLVLPHCSEADALEIGRAIRGEVGDDFPVGLALTYDEVIGSAGITPEDTEAQLEHLAATGVYDFFDVSIGVVPSKRAG